MSASLCSLPIRAQHSPHTSSRVPAVTSQLRVCLCFTNLWDPERRVDGQAWAEACEGLDVGGGGQRPSALSVDGEGQRFEVLGVDMPVLSSHRLQEVLAGDNLWVQKHKLALVR